MTHEELMARVRAEVLELAGELADGLAHALANIVRDVVRTELLAVVDRLVEPQSLASVRAPDNREMRPRPSSSSSRRRVLLHRPHARSAGREVTTRGRADVSRRGHGGPLSCTTRSTPTCSP